MAVRSFSLASEALASDREDLEDLVTLLNDGPDALPARAKPLRERDAPAWVRRELFKELPKDAPDYIRNCLANPDRRCTNIAYIWKRDNPGCKTRFGVKCGSWRCPNCRTYASRMLYSRIREATADARARDCLFLVLTLDGPLHTRNASKIEQLYRELGRRWQRFRQRLSRWLVSVDMKPLENTWVRTVEKHQSGMPHLNVLIHHPGLASAMRAEKRMREVAARCMGDELRWLRGPLLAHAQAVGFGPRSTLEHLTGDVELSRVASYLAKNAKAATRVAAEIAKQSQLPTNAPRSLRRYSAGRGWLPPRRKDPDVTGAVFVRRPTPEGDEVVEPLVRPKDPEALAEVLATAAYEEGLLLARYSRGHAPGKQADDYTRTHHQVPRGPPRGPPE